MGWIASWAATLQCGNVLAALADSAFAQPGSATESPRLHLPMTLLTREAPPLADGTVFTEDDAMDDPSQVEHPMTPIATQLATTLLRVVAGCARLHRSPTPATANKAATTDATPSLLPPLFLLSACARLVADMARRSSAAHAFFVHRRGLPIAMGAFTACSQLWSSLPVLPTGDSPVADQAASACMEALVTACDAVVSLLRPTRTRVWSLHVQLAAARRRHQARGGSGNVDALGPVLPLVWPLQKARAGAGAADAALTATGRNLWHPAVQVAEGGAAEAAPGLTTTALVDGDCAIEACAAAENSCGAIASLEAVCRVLDRALIACNGAGQDQRVAMALLHTAAALLAIFAVVPPARETLWRKPSDRASLCDILPRALLATSAQTPHGHFQHAVQRLLFALATLVHHVPAFAPCLAMTRAVPQLLAVPRVWWPCYSNAPTPGRGSSARAGASSGDPPLDSGVATHAADWTLASSKPTFDSWLLFVLERVAPFTALDPSTYAHGSPAVDVSLAAGHAMCAVAQRPSPAWSVSLATSDVGWLAMLLSDAPSSTATGTTPVADDGTPADQTPVGLAAAACRVLWGLTSPRNRLNTDPGSPPQATTRGSVSSTTSSNDALASTSQPMEAAAVSTPLGRVLWGRSAEANRALVARSFTHAKVSYGDVHTTPRAWLASMGALVKRQRPGTDDGAAQGRTSGGTGVLISAVGALHGLWHSRDLALCSLQHGSVLQQCVQALRALVQPPGPTTASTADTPPSLFPPTIAGRLAAGIVTPMLAAAVGECVRHLESPRRLSRHLHTVTELLDASPLPSALQPATGVSRRMARRKQRSADGSVAVTGRGCLQVLTHGLQAGTAWLPGLLQTAPAARRVGGGASKPVARANTGAGGSGAGGGDGDGVVGAAERVQRSAMDGATTVGVVGVHMAATRIVEVAANHMALLPAYMALLKTWLWSPTGTSPSAPSSSSVSSSSSSSSSTAPSSSVPAAGSNIVAEAAPTSRRVQRQQLLAEAPNLMRAVAELASCSPLPQLQVQALAVVWAALLRVQDPAQHAAHIMSVTRASSRARSSSLRLRQALLAIFSPSFMSDAVPRTHTTDASRGTDHDTTAHRPQRNAAHVLHIVNCAARVTCLLCDHTASAKNLQVVGVLASLLRALPSLTLAWGHSLCTPRDAPHTPAPDGVSHHPPPGHCARCALVASLRAACRLIDTATSAAVVKRAFADTPNLHCLVPVLLSSTRHSLLTLCRHQADHDYARVQRTSVLQATTQLLVRLMSHADAGVPLAVLRSDGGVFGCPLHSTGEEPPQAPEHCSWCGVMRRTSGAAARACAPAFPLMHAAARSLSIMVHLGATTSLRDALRRSEWPVAQAQFQALHCLASAVDVAASSRLPVALRRLLRLAGATNGHMANVADGGRGVFETQAMHHVWVQQEAVAMSLASFTWSTRQQPGTWHGEGEEATAATAAATAAASEPSPRYHCIPLVDTLLTFLHDTTACAQPQCGPHQVHALMILLAVAPYARLRSFRFQPHEPESPQPDPAADLPSSSGPPDGTHIDPSSAPRACWSWLWRWLCRDREGGRDDRDEDSPTRSVWSSLCTCLGVCVLQAFTDVPGGDVDRWLARERLWLSQTGATTLQEVDADAPAVVAPRHVANVFGGANRRVVAHTLQASHLAVAAARPSSSPSPPRAMSQMVAAQRGVDVATRLVQSLVAPSPSDTEFAGVHPAFDADPDASSAAPESDGVHPMRSRMLTSLLRGVQQSGASLLQQALVGACAAVVDNLCDAGAETVATRVASRLSFREGDGSRSGTDPTGPTHVLLPPVSASQELALEAGACHVLAAQHQLLDTSVDCLRACLSDGMTTQQHEDVLLGTGHSTRALRDSTGLPPSIDTMSMHAHAVALHMCSVLHNLSRCAPDTRTDWLCHEGLLRAVASALPGALPPAPSSLVNTEAVSVRSTHRSLVSFLVHHCTTTSPWHTWRLRMQQVAREARLLEHSARRRDTGMAGTNGGRRVTHAPVGCAPLLQPALQARRNAETLAALVASGARDGDGQQQASDVADGTRSGVDPALHEEKGVEGDGVDEANPNPDLSPDDEEIDEHAPTVVATTATDEGSGGIALPALALLTAIVSCGTALKGGVPVCHTLGASEDEAPVPNANHPIGLRTMQDAVVPLAQYCVEAGIMRDLVRVASAGTGDSRDGAQGAGFVSRRHAAWLLACLCVSVPRVVEEWMSDRECEGLDSTREAAMSPPALLLRAIEVDTDVGTEVSHAMRFCVLCLCVCVCVCVFFLGGGVELVGACGCCCLLNEPN